MIIVMLSMPCYMAILVNTASSLLLPLYSGRNKSLVSHVVRIQVLEEEVQWRPPLEISSET